MNSYTEIEASADDTGVRNETTRQTQQNSGNTSPAAHDVSHLALLALPTSS